MSYTSVAVRDANPLTAFSESEETWISKDMQWKVVASVQSIESAPKEKFREVAIYQFVEGQYQKRTSRIGIPRQVMQVYREFYQNLFLEGTK